MRRFAPFFPALLAALPLAGVASVPAASAQTASASASSASIEARLYDEGMRRSQVMQTAHVLTDVFGPRLTGSPALERAGTWALDQLTAWGLSNPTRAPWSWGHDGWANERVHVQMTAPVPTTLVAEALGWTPSTPGPVSGRLVWLAAPTAMSAARWQIYADSVRRVVRGAVVLVGEPGVTQGGGPSLQQRIADDEARRRFTPRPADATPAGTPPAPRPQATPPAVPPLSAATVGGRLDSLLRRAGALARVNPAGMENGLIRAFSNRSFDVTKAVPTVVLRDEDYGRIVRLLRSSAPAARRMPAPRLTVDVRNTVYRGRATEHNYLAEIPGTMPGEVVMLGGHLDSWHAATGATDNAAGSAVMMEAARLLAKAFRETGTRPRRTIRVALWTGEEQGLLGSRAYVEQTFGSAEAPTPAWAGFNGYFNVDSGTGKLRGAVVFGPTEAAEVLQRYLQPLDSLGVAGARPTFSRAIGGSDHTAFNHAGLPGISMGQDPIAYFSTTWHTNVDTYERLLPRDLMQAAVAVAVGVYRLATEETPLPRFAPADLPAAPPTNRPGASSR